MAGGNGRWNTNSNWSSGTVPTSNDDVTINAGVTVTVRTPGGNAVARTLTLGSGATVARQNGLTLAVGQGITVSSGNATLNIPFTAGSISKSGSGTLTISQSGTVTGNVGVSGTGTLIFTGTATISAGSFNLASGSALTLNFSTTTTVALLTVSGNATIAGTLNLTGSAPAVGGSPYHLIRSTGGTINFTGLSLGTVPAGLTFGFRVLGTDLVMDVTQNPIAIDSVASTTGTCAAGTVTWQHTVGATANDRLLIVGVSTGSNTASALPTSVTYGSQTVTARGGDNAGTTQVQIYTLLAPARGTNTVTLTFPASTCFVVAGSVSYTGVNQANAIGAVVSDTETGNTPLLATVDVNVQSHDKVFGVLSSNTATSATPVQSNVTARWSALNGTEYGTAETLSYGGTTNATVTLSYNMGPPSSTFWSLAALPIHPANANAAAPRAPVVRSSAAGALLSWDLGPTSDVVGFRVWRQAGTTRELLTPGLVAGPLLATRATLIAGSQPGWVDPRPVAGATYLVESLHRDGSIRWTPAVAGSGRAPMLASQLVASPSSVLSPERPALRMEAAEPPSLPPSPGSRELQWQLAGGEAVKLVVSQPGVVRVPVESLFAAGLPVGTAASSVQLFRDGRPVSRTVRTADGSTLRPGDSVEFYGHGLDTRYSGSVVYWLTAGDGRGKQIPTSSAPAQPVDTGSFLAATEVRERLTWFGAARNGDAEKFFGTRGVQPGSAEKHSRRRARRRRQRRAAGGFPPGRHRDGPCGERVTQRARPRCGFFPGRGARERQLRPSARSARPWRQPGRAGGARSCRRLAGAVRPASVPAAYPARFRCARLHACGRERDTSRGVRPRSHTRAGRDAIPTPPCSFRPGTSRERRRSGPRAPANRHLVAYLPTDTARSGRGACRIVRAAGMRPTGRTWWSSVHRCSSVQ